MMRPEVIALLELGALPASSEADVEWLREFERRIGKISRPVSDEEARVLINLFGPDDCFGAAWELVHLIETAPSWPIAECLQDTSNEWIRRLRQRAENSGYKVS